jgi:hypothetical protein
MTLTMLGRLKHTAQPSSFEGETKKVKKGKLLPVLSFFN